MVVKGHPASLWNHMLGNRGNFTVWWTIRPVHASPIIWKLVKQDTCGGTMVKQCIGPTGHMRRDIGQTMNWSNRTHAAGPGVRKSGGVSAFLTVSGKTKGAEPPRRRRRGVKQMPGSGGRNGTSPRDAVVSYLFLNRTQSRCRRLAQCDPRAGRRVSRSTTGPAGDDGELRCV